MATIIVGDVVLTAEDLREAALSCYHQGLNQTGIRYGGKPQGHFDLSAKLYRVADKLDERKIIDADVRAMYDGAE